MTERHLINAAGTEIAYTDHGGDGPPTVLVHGITECDEVWRPVIDRIVGDRHVFTMDLRGHGASGAGESYDLESMAGDVVAVLQATGTLGTAHLVGHSLGGIVVTAVGAGAPVASIINVDQSLRLGAFKDQLVEFEPMLRDPATFPTVMDGLFAQLGGEAIDPAEMARVNGLRNARQEVVLGVWDLIFSLSTDEINAIIEAALSGYADSNISYLTVFGDEPEPGYADWISSFIPNATTEVWPGDGHYPHLVDPDRFVARIQEFWTTV